MMDIERCCVKGCTITAQNLSLYDLRLFNFPKDERRIIWAINCDREDIAILSPYRASSYRVCSLHFEDEMFVSFLKCQLKDTAIPTILNPNIPEPQQNISLAERWGSNTVYTYKGPASNKRFTDLACSAQYPDYLDEVVVTSGNEIVIYEETLQDSQNMEEYRCCTCLNITDKSTCTNINECCYLNLTVKEVIGLLDLKMVYMLNHNEVVCNGCLNILKSCLEFEAIPLECSENASVEVLGDAFNRINVEHDYCSQVDFGDVQQIEGLENANENVLVVEDPVPGMEDVSVDDNTEVMSKRSINRTHRKRKKYNPKKQHKQTAQTFSCTFCSETFTVKEEYNLHLKIHPRFICDVCGKMFFTSMSLKIHQYSHNAPNTYICEVCGKGFKEKNGLRSHRKRHRNSTGTFMCDKCPKIFNRIDRLNYHIRTVHTKTEGWQCPQCGILVKHQVNLKSHIKLVHGAEKPYECHICNRKFARADYLRNHLSRHTRNMNLGARSYRLMLKMEDNGKPVPCKFCGRWCINVRNLRKHLQTHVKRYPCHFCPLTFSTKLICQKHETAHEGGKVKFFRCNTCWKRFKTKEALDEHAVRHDNPLYSCEICQKTFNRRFLLNHHRLAEHNDPDKEHADEVVYNSLLEIDEGNVSVITSKFDVKKIRTK